MRTNSEQRQYLTCPDVSICIATCNQIRYITQCIESVLTQTGNFSWELLVGDDCSDDGTSEEISRLLATLSHATHIRHAPRKGASANMQFLFAHARGRYVAHLDGDDYWLPGKLKQQVEFMEHHPQCVAVYTNALVVDDHCTVKAIFNDAGDCFVDLNTLLNRGNFLNNSSMMLRREQLSAFNSIDRPFLDFEGHLLHARAGLLGHIGEPLVAYRANAQGSLVATANERTREMYFQAIAGVKPGEVPPTTLTRAFADFLRRVLFRALRTRDPHLFIHWWRKVCTHTSVSRSHLAMATARAFMDELIRQVTDRVRNRKPPILYRS